VSAKLLLLTTTSIWDSKDEFDRTGITLSQGILLEESMTGFEKVLEIYNSFEDLTKFHKIRYQDLGSLLQYLATQGTDNDARKLAYEIFISLSDNKAESSFQPFRYLVEYLQSVLQRQNAKLRVSTKFPWSEKLGFFALIGLQATMNNIRSIAGGNSARVCT
jgi:hypothetical protein